MAAYIVRRLLIGIVIILIVTVMIFLFMRLLPGDPLVIYVSQSDMSNLSPEQMAALKHKFGLDKSMRAAVCQVDNGGSSAAISADPSIMMSRSAGSSPSACPSPFIWGRCPSS